MKNYVIFIIIILGIQAVYGERILTIDLGIYKNDSVKFNYIKIEEGNPTFYTTPGDYIVQIKDKNRNILSKKELGIQVLPDGYSLMHLSLVYVKGMSHLDLYNKDILIFTKEITSCNKNGICDQDFESYISCPSDCPLNKPDGICLKALDGVCDPDCNAGVDPDCAKKAEIACYMDQSGRCENDCTICLDKKDKGNDTVKSAGDIYQKIEPKDLFSNPAIVSLLLISGAACYLLIYRFFKIREDKRRNG